MSRTKRIVVLAATFAVLPLTAIAADKIVGPCEMTAAAMNKAFHGFKVYVDEKTNTVRMIGTQSPECMKLYHFSNSPDDGAFRAQFDGGPEKCKDQAELKCETIDGKSSCAQLSTQEGTAMDMDKMSDEAKEDAKDVKIGIVARKVAKNDPYADIPDGMKEDETFDQFKHGDQTDKKAEKIFYTSNEVLEQEKKEREEKLAKKKLKRCDEISASCKGTELGLAAILYKKEHDESAKPEKIEELLLGNYRAELDKLKNKLNATLPKDEKFATLKERIAKFTETAEQLTAEQKETLNEEIGVYLKTIARRELKDPSSTITTSRERQVATMNLLQGLLGADEQDKFKTEMDGIYHTRIAEQLKFTAAMGFKSEGFQEAYKLQLAEFNGPLAADGCLLEDGKVKVTQDCVQKFQLIQKNPEYQGFIALANNANSVQKQIDKRINCEQGIGIAAECQAILQQQANVLDPNAMNMSASIPNPFYGNALNPQLNSLSMAGNVNGQLQNQVSGRNPYYDAIPNTFNTVDPNLSVNMGPTQNTNLGTVQNTILNPNQQFRPIQPVIQQPAVNPTFLHRG